MPIESASETGAGVRTVRRLMSALVIVHRYLGVVVGAIMTLWCLSGFVMMYSGYPRLTEAARLAGLEPLRLEGCCAPLPDSITGLKGIRRFDVEMLAGRPVLRLMAADGHGSVTDLKTGAALNAINESAARTVAADFAATSRVKGSVRDITLIAKDQWTVQDAERRGPVYRVRFADPAESVVYVARATGEVVQKTTARQRLLGWLGAVPHWLYPTLLRQNPALWSDVVVWTSALGVFLTVTGLYIGITRFRRRQNGRWSPYRGLFWWHQVIGLVFGFLTLTWVASGLLTVNPCGLLDSLPGVIEQARLAGDIDGSQLQQVLEHSPAAAQPPIVALKSTPLAGRLYLMAIQADGQAQRLDASGHPAPLTADELSSALRAQLGAEASAPVLITRPNAYDYDSYDRAADLPAYRVALSDAVHTTLYLDPASGAVVRAVDDTQRLSRWTRTGLHDWDFAAIRARPLWDILVLAMLAGVTAVCALGAWMGVRRAGRDWAALTHRKSYENHQQPR